MVSRIDVSNTQVNKQINKLEKKKTKGGALAATASIAGSSAVQLSSLPVGIAMMNIMSSQSKKLSESQINTIMNSAENFIKSTGIDKKGVVIHNITKAPINLSCIPDKLLEYINMQTSIAKGKNAAFFNKPVKAVLGEIAYDKNSILINKDKFSTAVFHEIGHAINYNKSKFWKAMQKMRMPGIYLADGLPLFAAFSNKAEAKDGEELTKGQKVKNALRNNAGKIAFASMVPMLMEEGMASIRGCKWANANLPKELAKKVLKTNIGGYASYLATALSLGFAAFSAVKIKDYFGKKHQDKIQAKIDNIKNNIAVEK